VGWVGIYRHEYACSDLIVVPTGQPSRRNLQNSDHVGSPRRCVVEINSACTQMTLQRIRFPNRILLKPHANPKWRRVIKPTFKREVQKGGIWLFSDHRLSHSFLAAWTWFIRYHCCLRAKANDTWLSSPIGLRLSHLWWPDTLNRILSILRKACSNGGTGYEINFRRIRCVNACRSTSWRLPRA